MRPATRTRPGAPGTASSPRPNGSRASRRAELLSPTCAQQGEAAELPAEQSSYLPFEGVSRHEAVNEYPLGNGSQGAEPTPSAVQAPRASERLLGLQPVQAPPPVTALPATARVGEEASLGERVVARHEAARRAAEQEKAEADTAAASAAAGSVEAPQMQHTPPPATAQEGQPTAQERDDGPPTSAPSGGASGGGKIKLPHQIARDKALADAGVSDLADAFDMAGFERIETIGGLDIVELTDEIAACCAPKPLRLGHRMALLRLLQSQKPSADASANAGAERLPDASVLVDQVDADADADADAFTGGGGGSGGGGAQTAPSKSPRAQKRDRQQAAARSKKAPTTATSAEALPEEPDASVDEVLGRQPLPPGDQQADGSSSAPTAPGRPAEASMPRQSASAGANRPPVPPSFVSDQLPLLFGFFNGLPPEDRQKDADVVIRGIFESIGVKELPSDDMEINADELESIMKRCMEPCGEVQGLSTFFTSSPVRSARALRLALRPIYRAVEERKTRSILHLENESSAGELSASAGVAIGAAMASASKDGGDADGAVSEGQRRVNDVANDPVQAAIVIELAKRGEAVNGDASAMKSFLTSQREAQRSHVELANLLCTAKIPTASGVCADPLSALSLLKGGGSSEALQFRRVEVAKAATRLQQLLRDYVARLELDPYLPGGETDQMVAALHAGNFVEHKIPTASTSFKVTDAITERPLSLFLPSNDGAKAKETFDALHDCIRAALYWLHPRDDMAESTLREVKRRARGPSGNKFYHNEALGELFKGFSKLVKQWQSGMRKEYPTLDEAWSRALHNPLLIDVLDGNAERDARCVKAEMLAEAADKRAAECERRAAAAEAKTSKTTPIKTPKQDRLLTETPPTGGALQSDNLVQGKARRVLGAEIHRLKQAAHTATSSAKSAEEAKESGAVEKRGLANKAQAAVDEALAKWAAKRA